MFVAAILFALGVLVGWNLKQHVLVEINADVAGVVSPGYHGAGGLSAQTDAQSMRIKGQPVSQSDFFSQWLQSREYRRAIEFLSLLPSKNDNQAFDYYRLRLFNSLLSAKELNPYEVVEIIDHYLSYYHDDYEFLVQKAMYKEAVADYFGALQTLYNAKLYVISPVMQKDIRDRIDKFVKDKMNILAKENPREVSRLIELVQEKEPQYVPLALMIAETQIKWREYDKAFVYLDNLPLDGIHDQRVNLLLSKIETFRQNVADAQPDDAVNAIPIERQGNHYVVDLEILGVGLTRLLIDTGASYTTLSSSVLAGLREPYGRIVKEVVKVNTANGQVEGQLIRTQLVRLGAYEIEDIEVIAIPLDNLANVDGLLGMNILKLFEFQIDQENDLLILK